MNDTRRQITAMGLWPAGLEQINATPAGQGDRD